MPNRLALLREHVGRPTEKRLVPPASRSEIRDRDSCEEMSDRHRRQLWTNGSGTVKPHESPATSHPEDAAVMYSDETHSGVRLTEESIGLWERHTRRYVEEVGR